MKNSINNKMFNKFIQSVYMWYKVVFFALNVIELQLQLIGIGIFFPNAD